MKNSSARHVPTFLGTIVLVFAVLGVACSTVSAHKDTSAAPPDSTLRNTYWKLVQLEGQPVQVADNQREPHLVFAADQQRVSGSGGCNRLMGGFELKNDQLRLGQIAGTMMACPSGMEQEQRFLQVLPRVERYRIQGDRLEMMDGAGEIVASFMAVALR